MDELDKARQRFASAVESVASTIDALMFDAPDALIYGEERWAWEPDEATNIDPRYPSIKFVSKYENDGLGLRQATWIAVEDHTYEPHTHSDACESVFVAHGEIRLVANGNAADHILSGGFAKVPARTPHKAWVREGTVFTLMYNRVGSCGFCLHKLGRDYLSTAMCRG